MFIDQARIHVRAGAGGDGVVSFRREKFVPRGGPDGGDGGRGGSVYLEASDDLNTLYSFHHKQHFHASPGGKGAGGRRHGAKGEDLAIKVPVGTVAYAEGEGMVADLDHAGDRVMVAAGGRGGLGNVHFATALRQTPRIAQKGEAGDEKWLDLELRLLADVGLVGLPNAGKSTLLARISAARPKIAEYPFTTLVPNLGVVAVGSTTFVAADIPGLIEGAHKGAGLGLDFLRHVQRTRLLIHLLDGSSPDPLHDLETVNRELREYSEELADKPQVIAFNKMDIPAARQAWPSVERRLQVVGYSVWPISAATGEGVQELVEDVARRLAQVPPPKVPVPAEEGLRVYRLEPTAQPEVSVVREGEAFRVTGRSAERAADLVNVSAPEGLAVLRQRLARLGVGKLMKKAGAREGDLVRVGEAEFPWRGEKG